MKHIDNFIRFLDSNQKMGTFEEIGVGHDSLVWAPKSPKKSVVLKQYDAQWEIWIDKLCEYHTIQSKYATMLNEALYEIPEEFWTVRYLGEVVPKITVSILKLPQETIYHQKMKKRNNRLISELPYIPGNTLKDWRQDTLQMSHTRKISEHEYKRLEMESYLVEAAVKSCLRNIWIPIMGWREFTEGYPLCLENIKLVRIKNGVLQTVVTDLWGDIWQMLRYEKWWRKK